MPNQSWAIGVPVHLDLAEYCSDADGDPLTFELTRPLPPGLTLQGSVISGTPTAPVPPTIFVAVASDGSQESRVPAASLRVSPNPGRGPVRITIRRRSDVGRYARLRVTNIAGATVYEQELWLGAATDEFEWNGAAKDGSRLASGAYIVSVLADSETVHTRFTLVR